MPLCSLGWVIGVVGIFLIDTSFGVSLVKSIILAIAAVVAVSFGKWASRHNEKRPQDT